MTERLFITPEQAVSVLADTGRIHTFRQGGPCLVGADWDKEDVLKALEQFKDKIELTGSMARSMKHGICFFDDHGPCYLETDEDKLRALESSLTPVAQ